MLNQSEILKTAKKQYQLFNHNHILGYAPLFVDTPGTLFLKRKFFRSSLKNYFLERVKNFLYFKHKLIKISKLHNKTDYTNVVITFGFKKSFKNQKYFDKFFNEDSYNSKILWIVIYLDKFLPNKLPKNVVLVYFKEENFVKKITFFIINLFENIFSFKKSYSSPNHFEGLYFNIKKIFNNLNLKKINSVIFPYEGQPFQKKIICYLKQNSKSLKIIGYDHTPPQNLPVNLFYTKNSPDKLYVTGSSQREFYSKQLMWPKKNIYLTHTLRFSKTNKRDFINKIFFPHDLKEQNLKQISDTCNRLIQKKGLFLKEILIHPNSIHKKKEFLIQKKLKDLINLKTNTKKLRNKNSSIFIGKTTGIALSLEKGIDTYHICDDKEFQMYDSKLWKNLKHKEILKNTFIYTQTRKKTFMLTKSEIKTKLL